MKIAFLIQIGNGWYKMFASSDVSGEFRNVG